MVKGTGKLRVLAGGLRCPGCGGDAVVERLGDGRVVWRDLRYLVRCAAGDYERELSGLALYRLEGVALKAA